MVTFQNGEDFLHKLYIRFNATIAVSLLPMAYLLLLLQSGRLHSIFDSTTNYWIISTCVTLAGLALTFWSQKRFRKSIAIQDAGDNLREKLKQYFSFSMNKYLEFMMIGILFTIGFFLTANKLFIVCYVISLILLSLRRPTLSVFLEDLPLTEEERKILLDKQNIA